MKQLVQNKFCNVSNLITRSVESGWVRFTPQESGRMQLAAEHGRPSAPNGTVVLLPALAGRARR